MAFKMTTSSWIVLGLGGLAAYLVVKGASGATSTITSNTSALPSPTPTYRPTSITPKQTISPTTTPTQTTATPQTDSQAASDWFSNLGGDSTPLPGGGN
jgi:hypothetical protein